MKKEELTYQYVELMRDHDRNLAFEGALIANREYSTGEKYELYVSRSGKYVLGHKWVDDEGDDHDEGLVFDSIDAVIGYFDNRFGPFSYTVKGLLKQASRFFPDLRQRFLETI